MELFRSKRNKSVLKFLIFFVAVTFVTSSVLPSAALASQLLLPAPTQSVPLSENYSFPVLKGLKFDQNNPFHIEFIIDTANQKKVTEEEASQLIRYFLAGLTMPEKDIWVNLSPYEKDRIVNDNLAQTDLGKDLLSQDYILKQLSSSLTYPESDTGKSYWTQIYSKVAQIAHTTKLPINTFNKIWITPESARVYEDKDFVIVTEARLKTMLEQDYLALQEHQKSQDARHKSQDTSHKTQVKAFGVLDMEEINKVASGVMRDFLLPKINEEVNSGKNFATLRQIYYSLILGVWFKYKFQDSIYKSYINQAKIKGIDLSDKDSKEKIYNLYVEAFQKGVYNYIKKDIEPVTNRQIKRQYISGGIVIDDLRRLIYFDSPSVGRAVIRSMTDHNYVARAAFSFNVSQTDLNHAGARAAKAAANVKNIQAAASPVVNSRGLGSIEGLNYSMEISRLNLAKLIYVEGILKNNLKVLLKRTRLGRDGERKLKKLNNLLARNMTLSSLEANKILNYKKQLIELEGEVKKVSSPVELTESQQEIWDIYCGLGYGEKYRPEIYNKLMRADLNDLKIVESFDQERVVERGLTESISVKNDLALLRNVIEVKEGKATSLYGDGFHVISANNASKDDPKSIKQIDAILNGFLHAVEESEKVGNKAIRFNVHVAFDPNIQLGKYSIDRQDVDGDIYQEANLTILVSSQQLSLGSFVKDIILRDRSFIEKFGEVMRQNAATKLENVDVNSIISSPVQIVESDVANIMNNVIATAERNPGANIEVDASRFGSNTLMQWLGQAGFRNVVISSELASKHSIILHLFFLSILNMHKEKTASTFSVDKEILVWIRDGDSLVIISGQEAVDAGIMNKPSASSPVTEEGRKLQDAGHKLRQNLIEADAGSETGSEAKKLVDSEKSSSPVKKENSKLHASGSKPDNRILGLQAGMQALKDMRAGNAKQLIEMLKKKVEDGDVTAEDLEKIPFDPVKSFFNTKDTETLLNDILIKIANHNDRFIAMKSCDLFSFYFNALYKDNLLLPYKVITGKGEMLMLLEGVQEISRFGRGYSLEPFDVRDIYSVSDLRDKVHKGEAFLVIIEKHFGSQKIVINGEVINQTKIYVGWIPLKSVSSSPVALDEIDLTGQRANGQTGQPINGGIDMNGINVKATLGSSSVTMPVFDFNDAEGMTFRIVKLEEVKDVNLALNLGPEETRLTMAK